ncbi:hypothetical protein [Nesterenkonia sandarakina]|uniref:Uncharacterized protein n=1 Tax=Nesterenkonia sandarakina TaxID=272918 RepID=A0A7Z0J2B0_9MICC|nr:hypothetical protein [Nesterenkonia sandarakina]NYJ15982.1 hypothetical protein [Nesterenkonia sandarakina]
MGDTRELTLASDTTLTFTTGLNLSGDIVMLCRAGSYIPSQLMLTTP